MRGLITAVRTLTVLPVPGKDAKDFSASLYFFPLIGALIGIAVGGSVYLLDLYLGWKELAAAAGVLVCVRLTGCLHVDGFADVCDSFGGQDRAKRLIIMRDSNVGVYGVAGVVLSLLLKYICLVRLDSHVLITAVPAVFVISRAAQVGVMVRMPYAREKGKAGAYLENAGARHLLFAGIAALIICWVMAFHVGLLAFVPAVVIVLAIRLWARRAFGGITGDIIGFTNELVEITGLISLGWFLG